MSRQVMSHPNPPAVVFPKRVGNDELKAHITDRVSQILNIMIPEIDCSNDVITVLLRRSATGRCQGFISHKYEITQKHNDKTGRVYKVEAETGHQQNTEIDFNLQKGTMNPTDNENEWLLILTHELIHWVQSKVGAHYTSKVQTRAYNNETNHYNTNNLRVITYRILEACGVASPSWGGFSTDGLEFTTGYDKDQARALTTSQYYKMPHEKQAHRLSYRIMKEVFKMTPPNAYFMGYCRTLENDSINRAVDSVYQIITA
jgi:hypothetical protein